MNFLAHLWLAERSGASLPGAILGDMVRGRDLSAWPPALAHGIRQHRRIDAATDRHPAVAGARYVFPAGARRYAGILTDLACDHLLARRWAEFWSEPLSAFCDRAGAALEADAAWFERAGGWRPRAREFSLLLQSYANEDGIVRAIRRTAGRLRDAAPLVAAGAHWPAAAANIAPNLAQLLSDLVETARAPRVATREDIPAMQRVRMAVRENPLTSRTLSEADYVEHLEGPARGWVAEHQGEIVGFAMARADTGNIWALFVDPAHEGRGHGGRLHGAMMDWLQQQGGPKPWLTTGTGTRAERFYERAGWRRVSVDNGEARFEWPYSIAATSLGSAHANESR